MSTVHPPAGWRPHAGVLVAVIAWGISFVATKVALVELTPVTLIFSRFGLGVVLLHGILALRGASLLPGRTHFYALGLMGFVGVFVHQLLQVHGLERTTAVRTGWLIGLIPIWSAVLAAVLLRERFGPVRAAGLALGFGGAVLVVTRGRLSGDFLALPQTTGDFLILASTVNWALYSVIGRGTLRTLGATRATAGAMLLGWILLLPLYVRESGWTQLAGLSASGWAALLFLGVVCSGFAYLFWYGGLERLDATRVSSYLYIEPLVTLAAAVAVLGEPVAGTTIAGGLLVLLGVWLVQRG
ncbi:MAG: DMT family transporter [Candidatus Eiseniibacteriota bacterium]